MQSIECAKNIIYEFHKDKDKDTIADMAPNPKPATAEQRENAIEVMLKNTQREQVSFCKI
jgi:hypothetical protein